MILHGAAAFVGVAFLLHMASLLAVAIRIRRAAARVHTPANGPAVSVIRPVCGVEDFAFETLGSGFKLDYPSHETLFCVAHAADPIVPFVKRLIMAYPRVHSQLLVGSDRMSENPKLNNVVKGWAAAKHDWIVMADSNVLMPRDYIQRMLAQWCPSTGLVCSPPLGCAPIGVWSELECSFLNTYQARWQYFADGLGFGFAQGKSMLMYRPAIDALGGLAALAAEPAEDAAATKMLRKAGLKIRLAGSPFAQPLGYRTLAEVWKRQVRWARLRRKTFPLLFIPELLTGIVAPLGALGFVVASFGSSILTAALALIIPWFSAELLLAYAAGWHLSRWSPLMLILRDVMIPAVWVAGWIGNDFVWRGNAMNVAETGQTG